MKMNSESATYIRSHNALLGHNKNEADEDSRAQHADRTHQRVGTLRLLTAEPCSYSADHDSQQPCHTGDGSKYQTGDQRET